MPDADRDKWNARYATEEPPREPSAVLVSLEPFLPSRGRALDVAGGAGRHALWLAGRGLDVTIADISSAGLAIARRRATEESLQIAMLEIDLAAEPFPAGPWDLIVSVCHVNRPLFAVYPSVLAPGGILAVIQPTKRNLERHAKPPAGFLLEDGELPSLVTGLEIVHYEEGWLADERHDAVLIAQRRHAE